MNQQDLEDELHISNYIIIYKFILGFVEFLLGVGIIIYGHTIIELYQQFTLKELLEDPNDLLVLGLQKIMPIIIEYQGYIVLILLILGIVKVVGSIGLMYRKHWGLDLLVGLTIFVLPFELYNLIVEPSLLKLVFLIINIFISLYLVEFQPRSYYNKFKKRVNKKHKNAPTRALDEE